MDFTPLEMVSSTLAFIGEGGYNILIMFLSIIFFLMLWGFIMKPFHKATKKVFK